MVENAMKTDKVKTEGGFLMAELKNTNDYLILFVDESSYEFRGAVSIRDLILETAKWTGISSAMFSKCVKGFDSNDLDGLVELFNHFSFNKINKIYQICSKIYG